MKRLFDFFVALLALIVLSPLLIVSAFLVRIKLGSPILFTQLRPGLHAKPFFIYKMRSMTNEKDENGKLLPNEKRLTRFGRLLRKMSIDELPQLYNVLIGDMSLVGPRPLIMDYLPLYSQEQARRHDVKPGITGWAQVNGRNAISWEEKFKLDVWYVDHQSIWLDIRILWLTVLKVIRRDGVNQSEHITMERFRGSN